MTENIIVPGNTPLQPKQVKKTGTSQTTGGVREGVAGSKAETPSRIAPPTEAPSQKGAGEARPETTVIRQLTPKDIGQHLLSLEIPNTDFNLKFASLMLRYGIELSKENLSTAFKLLAGTNKGLNSQEAILVLINKGIDSPVAVRVLENFFSENPQLASQIINIKEAILNLQNALSANKQLLNTNFITQLGSLIFQFEKTLTNSEAFLKNPASVRSQMVGDVRALKALLIGLEQKSKESQPTTSAEKDMLSSSINSAAAKLNDIFENLLAQAILSQTPKKGDVSASNYSYYQIPNPLVKPQNTVDLLIKKEGEGTLSSIDPRNTQIIMSLDSPNLGKISIHISVKDKNLNFVFNTTNDEARSLIARESSQFRHKLSDEFKYNTSGFQVKVNPAETSIESYLLPLLDLNHLLTIDTKI